ncbi:MAG: hypothetical protein DRO14_00595 [Thermoprotei archaeon]|nr:MAG: hypothetical protein DRO14_00595 [Thermoprotei archaeon]
MTNVIATIDDASGIANQLGAPYSIRVRSGADDWELSGDKTLFLAHGMKIPVRLLDAGFSFLDTWEMAVPLWNYGTLAADVGTVDERKLTRSVVLDLRQLLHGYELLFVRNDDAGREFLVTWRSECLKGEDERLAFLRAFHIVKPRACILPQSWLVYATAGELKQERVEVRPSRRRRRPWSPITREPHGSRRGPDIRKRVRQR